MVDKLEQLMTEDRGRKIPVEKLDTEEGMRRTIYALCRLVADLDTRLDKLEKEKRDKIT